LRGNEIDFESVKNKNDLVKEFDFYQIQIAEVDILFELEKAKKSIENKKKIKEENYEAQLRRIQMIKEGKCITEVQKIDTKLTAVNGISSITFTKSTQTTTDDCGVLLGKASKWKIIMKNNCGNYGLMIGVAPNTFNCGTSQYMANGYYIHTANCYKYGVGGSGSAFQSLASKIDNDGSVIIIEYKNGELSYTFNGTYLGVAYTGLPTDLFPAITYIYQASSSFEVEVLA